MSKIRYEQIVGVAAQNHTHNGTNSQRIDYNDLTNRPTINNARQTIARLVGSSGTILSTQHLCGNYPIVQCVQDGQIIEIDIAISGGDIYWASNEEFHQDGEVYMYILGSDNYTLI